MIEVKAYRCEYCGKLYINKKRCVKHELICKYNPENKVICFGCKHYIPISYDEGINGESPYCDYVPPRCGLNNITMCSAKKYSKLREYIKDFEIDNNRELDTSRKFQGYKLDTIKYPCSCINFKEQDK